MTHLDHPAPRAARLSTPAFDLYGPEIPQSPVILSVPHAGRAYETSLTASARVPVAVLRRLEDRWADLLAHDAIAQGYSVIVARAPRALIDLNRHVQEVDPAMVRGLPHGQPLRTSAKLRGGLGLIPRRLHGVGELWRQPLDWAEVQSRVERVHRPYHTEIARLMNASHMLHGHAILVDLHSMPSLPVPANETAPAIVLGDRFGRSAGGRLIALVADIAAGRGIATAQNHPYSGDYLLGLHGRPDAGLHALQVEIDRALYLDGGFDLPGAGLASVRHLVNDILGALARELPRADYVMAAE